MKLKLSFPKENKGGPGSGHHGHAGRKGQIGGSVSETGGLGNDENVGWQAMRRAAITQYVQAGGDAGDVEALQKQSTQFLEKISSQMSKIENLRRKPLDWAFYKAVGVELGIRENQKSGG